MTEFFSEAGLPHDPIFGFRVIEHLGSGARTSIYRVEDKAANVFALKHLIVRSKADRRCLAQMRCEHDVARQIDHPGIRKTHQLRVRRSPFRVSEAALLMECVAGQACDHSKSKSVSEVAQLMLQVAEALACLHRAGWIHADVKPTNLVQSPDGIVLIDLGQATRVGLRKDRIQGTPGFIAPEQVLRDRITQRTDVFGFGATLYWMLSGKTVPTVIEGEDLYARGSGGQIEEGLPRLIPLHEHRGDVPIELSDMITQCVAYAPDDRPPGISAVLGLLDRLARRS